MERACDAGVQVAGVAPVCDCTNWSGTRNTGYTRRDDGVWVHAACMRPSLPIFLKDVDVKVDLHIFRGGPLHNELRTSEDLLHKRDPELVRRITEYRWVPETLTGSESGRVARVWKHHTME